MSTPLPSFTPAQSAFFDQVTELLNTATNTGSGTIELTPLKQLSELVLHSRVGRSQDDTIIVMDHLLPELSLRLQSSSSKKVKLWLLEFLEALLRIEPTTFTPTTLNIVTSMTAEENIDVVKKVLSISCSLFPRVYSWLLFHGQSWGARHEHMFRTVEQLKDQCIALWKGSSESINAIVIKFLEIAILTLSNEKSTPLNRSADRKDELRPFSLKEIAADHPVLTQTALKEDVNHMLTTLLGFTPSVHATFSGLLRTLSIINKQRPQFSEKIVDKLTDCVELIVQEEVQLRVLPSDQQVTRVKTDLQACLIEVLKNLSFSLTNFDTLQQSLVQSLTLLGAESKAQGIVQAQSVKRAEHVKAAGASYAKEIARTEQATTIGTQQSRPQPLPLTSLMHQLDELSRLPVEYVVELISQSLNRFTVPPSCAASYAAPDPSPTFLSFLEECLMAPFNSVRAETSQGQRQQFQPVAEIIRTHANDAMDILYNTPASQPKSIQPPLPHPLAPVRTVVPPVPVPELTPAAASALSLSSFQRIASERTSMAVERSGETMLRSVILAKLASTNLLHQREYTCVVRPELDVTSKERVTWTSSAMKQPQPLRAYLTGKMADESGYEGVLNVLYSLLCIDPSSASIHTQVLAKEVDDASSDEPFGEDGLETAATTHEDEEEHPDDDEKEKNEASEDSKDEAKDESKEDDTKEDADMTDSSAADASSSTSKKRKRTDGDDSTPPTTSTDGDGDSTAEVPDSKRAKSDPAVKMEPIVDEALLAEMAVLPAFNEHGTVEYGEALELILAELKEGSTIESQQLYRRFLLDLPLLTPKVFASIDDWIYEPSRSVIGLSALRDLILYRPPVRQTALDLLLGYTHKPPLAQLRNQALRLVVNQLYNPNQHLRPPIVAHANKMLDMLTQPDEMLHDLPEIIVNVVVPPVPVYDQIDIGPPTSVTKKDSTVSTPGTPAPITPSASTPSDSPQVKVENPPPIGSPALVSQPSAEDRKSRAEAADLKTRQEIANLIADAERRKKKFDRLVFVRSLREKELKLMEQQRDERQKRRIDRVTRHMELYLSLCVHEPNMFRRLLHVYSQCTSEFIRKCIHDQMARLVRVLNRIAPEQLAKVLESETLDAPVQSETGIPSCEPLVLHCLQLMTATGAPSPSVVQSAVRMYQARASPRYLVPVLAGLPLDAIKRYLPKLITLPTDELRFAFQKLLHSRPPSSIKPSELLIQLHLLQPEPRRRPQQQATIDPAQVAKEKKEDEEALDKRVIAATKLCFDDPESFPAEVLGVVLSQLSDQTPLPKLLMRTVMQSMMLHVSLKSFILSNILIKLINRHIYQVPILWSGLLAACNMLLPQSIPILIQLPDHAFMTLMNNPKMEKMQMMLIQFIQSYPLQVRRSIRELVQQIVQERSVNQMAMQQQQPIMHQ